MAAPTTRFEPRDSAVRFASSKRSPDSSDIPAINPVSLPRYIIIPNTSSRHDPTIGATTSDIAITPVHSFNTSPIDNHQNVFQLLCMSSNAPV